MQFALYFFLLPCLHSLYTTPVFLISSYGRGCGNIEPTTRHFDLFSPPLSCSPYTLYTVQFQFTGHSLDLSDNVLHNWMFPHHCIWHTIGPKSFLFGTTQFSLWAIGAVKYDYIVTNSINSLLIGSRCISNGTHTNHF